MHTLTPTQRDWLTSPESLTKRLRHFTRNAITHHLFYDNWGDANPLEYGALAIDPSVKTWIRRMEWRLDNTTWVICSVVIPETSITDETEELKHIKQRSIGDILFQDNTLKRSEFTFIENANNQWTRHSIFYFKKQPLLVVENFQPAFFDATVS